MHAVIPDGPKGSYNEKFSSDVKVSRARDHWISVFFGVQLHLDPAR